MDRDEHELLKRCLENDRSAQFELYQRYSPRMYALCLRYCRSSDLAQDALQEGFVRIFKNINQFRFECPLEFWIRRIMINSALRILKSESSIHSSELEHTVNVSENSQNPIKHDYEVLLQAVEQLPNGFRTVFYLFAIDGLSHKEIGEHLGISEGTSKSQYARARKRLQNELKHLYPEFSADL